MDTDAYCCPMCGYFELPRPVGDVPVHAACPTCSASSARLLTPPILARMNPMVGADPDGDGAFRRTATPPLMAVTARTFQPHARQHLRGPQLMDPIELTQQVFHVLETGDADLATTIFAPDYVNHAAEVSPAACRLPGPAAALATGTWLRSAYPDLRYTVLDVVEHGDQIWSRVRMSGRHTGAFVRFRDGHLDQVIPPTGRAIDVAHFHVLTRRREQVVAHEALRDDLTMIRQLGVLPPNPRAIARIATWRLTGRAARAADDVTERAERAARQVPSARPT